MTILRAALLSVRIAEAWAWALDEARWQLRDVYAIDTHRPYLSHV